MLKARSIADALRSRARLTPTVPALLGPADLHKGDARQIEGDVAVWNWADTGARVKRIACGLCSLGIEMEDRVAILSSTRLEWVFANFGVLSAGAAVTAIYPNSDDESCRFILQDSGARVLMAENARQAERIARMAKDLPDLKVIVLFDFEAFARPEGAENLKILSLDELEAQGRAYGEAHPEAYDERVDAITPQNLSTLIYTSGTTGKPKGVELIHDNWLYIGESVFELRLLDARDLQFLWLPLSHVFGSMLCVLVAYNGVTTAVDGRIDKIVENLARFKPTFMSAVPRIFEKVYNNIVKTVHKGGKLAERAFHFARAVGREVSACRREDKPLSIKLAIQYALADKLVFSRIRKNFGGSVRFFISGSAPINRDIIEFFDVAGLLILEGYGLTESTAASVFNRLDDHRFGTVGPAMPNTQIRIGSDGEIFLKSRGIMRGYHNNPEATEAALCDGWFATGDIGELDEQGHLTITDRKKDLIKTSGGKYVAPQRLEAALQGICPYIAQILIHGERRNFCTALITLDEKEITSWAREQGMGELDMAALAKHPQVQALIQQSIDLLNQSLARFETIKKFAILPEPFTEARGELTASLKVKRKAVEAHYREILDAFYDGSLAKE